MIRYRLKMSNHVFYHNSVSPEPNYIISFNILQKSLAIFTLLIIYLIMTIRKDKNIYPIIT
ncbi:hypothetical protein CBU03nite_18290 [Clostridium butyricum]|uniref:Uncharacterized protein n=1 Tax=Clostridium butyricum TaxID=1492 RepID=A0A512TMT4_CLOBU|nr:hypothetical protein Cbu04g_21230 [Clostridium butyricum]GEQ21579.1 hypothetical protein CBU02nite_20850 [Clostridium butyricum]GEQ25406.1 hypothetical protein CBU03nite_18290 [Clostridium butyricum]